MKNIYLFLLFTSIIAFHSLAQDKESTQPGHIAMHIIPKGSDVEEAKKVLQALGESMKSADGCLAVYTSGSGIAGPSGPTDYLMIQTIHWKSDMDLFNWADKESGKIMEKWGDKMQKLKIQMFSFKSDNSLN